MKVASFHVRATVAQSARWKQAADSEGLAVGSWLAGAADAYLKVRARAGLPLPLAWGRGRFRVRLEGGAELEVRGWMARPFGLYHGSETRLVPHGSTHLYTLVYLPACKPLATFRTAGHCKALASELARLWVRWGGQEPAENPAPVLQRFQREDV